MGYDRIDGKKLFFLLCTLFLGITLQAQNQDFSRVKSKYDFKTEATEKLMLLMSESTKYDEALKFADTKIAESRKVNQYEELVLLLERKAELFRRLQQFDEAEKTATQAIEIAKNQLGKNHFLLAKSYLTRGIIQHRKADFYTASSNFDTAQVAYESSIQYDSLMYERIIDYKYYAYSYSEKNVDTLKKYIKIRLSEKLKDVDSNPEEILGLMNDLPNIYRTNGDFSQALSYAIEGVIYSEEHKDEIESNSHILSYYNIVYTLYLMKEYEVGLKICNSILNQYSHAKTTKDIPSINTFRSLRVSILTGLGKYDLAIEEYLQLIKEFNTVTKTNEIIFLVQLKINLAASFLKNGELKRAKDFLDQALEQIKSKNKLPYKQASYLYTVLGDYYHILDDDLSSFQYYDSAIRNGIPEYFNGEVLSFPKIMDQKVSFNVLTALKEKSISLNNLYDINRDSTDLLLISQNYALEVHEILVKRRKEFMRSEGSLFFSKNFKSLYEKGIESSYKMIQKEDDQTSLEMANKFFEISKAILFLEQAGEFDLMNQKSIPQYLKERFYLLKKENDELSTKFSAMFNEDNITSDSLEHLNKDLLVNNTRLFEFKDSISTLIPDADWFNNSKYTKQQNSRSLSKDQTIIEYFVGENEIFILGKTSNKTVLNKLTIDSVFLHSFESVINEISNKPILSNYEKQLGDFTKSSFYLYKSLLQPTLIDLDINTPKITIIPDEYLSKLPFETLLTTMPENNSSFKELPYLIKMHQINYQLSSKQEFGNGVKATDKNILGIGFGIESSYQKEITALPGTEIEIKMLQSNFSGDYYSGAAATKKLFLEKAMAYDILHLAVHGQTDESGKYKSRLIFNGADSILSTQDLYLADLKARLVVLSACESGLGQINKGEGTFSIARGFALVGVPSIVMSLWNVNDKVTSQLMLRFYEYLSKGNTSTNALTKSKLSYLEQSDNYSAHPYYWSSFVSLGDPIQLYPKPLNYPLIFSISLAWIISMLLILYYNKQKKRRTN